MSYDNKWWQSWRRKAMAAAKAYVPLPDTQKYVLPNRCTTNPQVRHGLRACDPVSFTQAPAN